VRLAYVEPHFSRWTSIMDNRLRDPRKNSIRAEDYDVHMAAVGQAQANALLVADYFAANRP